MASRRQRSTESAAHERGRPDADRAARVRSACGDSGSAGPDAHPPDTANCSPARCFGRCPLHGGVSPAFHPEEPVHHTVSKVAQTTAIITLPAPECSTVRKDSAKRQLVNQNKLFLDYQIENPRQSNAANVELWITRDQGKTWTKHAQHTRAKSPIEVNMPEDGLYGLSLVVVNSHNKKHFARWWGRTRLVGRG